MIILPDFIKNLLYKYTTITTLSYEEIQILSVQRSRKWTKLKKSYIKQHPNCAVCGSLKLVVPHHIIPFHIDKSKELDPNNLITLCENKVFNCHLFFGHLKNWSRYNPNIIEDAKTWKEKLTSTLHFQ
jgi:hypothetical protein